MEPRLRRAGEREAKRHRREETRRAGPKREKTRRGTRAAARAGRGALRQRPWRVSVEP